MSLPNVEVNDTLLRDFRKFAVEKHGKIYGVLKPEVEAALAEHMKAQKPSSSETL